MQEEKRNEKLHLLYTKWACQHLTTIEKCCNMLSDYSNINLIAVITTIVKERERLIKENPAYADAAEILQLIKDSK